MMVEGKRSSEWDHTASIMALLINCHRDPDKSKPANYEDFHPYAKKSEHKGSKAGLVALAQAAAANRFK